jgi:hypothetical protein
MSKTTLILSSGERKERERIAPTFRKKETDRQ